MKPRRGRPTGYRLSEESKHKISRSKTGYTHTNETRKKIKNTLLKYFDERGIGMSKVVLNHDELEKLSVDANGEGILLVEAHNMFNFMDGSWKCEDVRLMGHEMTEISLSNKTLENKDGEPQFLDLSGKGHCAKWQPCCGGHLYPGAVPIREDNDFDGMYDRITAFNPAFLTSGRLPYIFVKSLRTTRTHDGKDYVFIWRRTKVPVTGDIEAIARSNHGANLTTDKLTLVRLNGKQPCNLTDEEKRNILQICGPMSMSRLCDIKTLKIKTAACGGYI